MIETIEGRLGYFNEITEYLDKYLIRDYDNIKTYIYNKPMGDMWLIRVPGATRGNLRIKNNKIISINLYEDTCFKTLKCYDKSVLDNINKFIGRKIVFKTKE